MEYRILGPLEIVDGEGRVVPLSGRHQPRVLAVLLCEAGRVVPVHRIVDLLWDGAEPPSTARRQVQNTIAALRRALRPHGESTLESVGDGYRIAPQRLDSREFLAGLDDARRIARAGRSGPAADRLGTVLRLWRDYALAGMEGGILETAAAELNRARLDALELDMELRVAVGRAEDVPPRASDLLRRHPHRQSLAALLMRALHRLGRTAEALAVFDETRRRLADDLGIDPSAVLRDAHRDVLRQDVPTPPPPVPGGPVPAQLPAAPRGFVGRASHLASLDLLLDDPTPAVVTGLGGIGKTSLVVSWARRRLDRFPDGQLFVDMRGYDVVAPLSPLDGLHRCLRALGVATDAVPDDVDEAAALYRSTIHDRRMLVVVDNARTVDQVRPLLPSGSHNLAIVTSRHVLAGLVAVDGARPVPLDVLDHGESHDLLAGLVDAGRLDADVDATRRLVDACGRLPLALRIVAAHLATNPAMAVARTAETLTTGDRLRRLALPGDGRSAVADSLDMSFRVLDEPTRLFAWHLGLIAAVEFEDSLAAAAAGVEDADEALDTLAAARLIDRLGDGRSRLHDLVHLYLRDRRGELSEEERDEAVDRIVEWWHECPAVTDLDGRKAAVLDHRDHPRVWRIAQNLSGGIHNGWNPVDIRVLAEIALESAVRAGDVAGQSIMHNLIGGTHWVAREIDAAVERGALALSTARESGDDAILSRHLINMAVYVQLRGDQLEAHDIVTEAIAVSRRSGSGRALASRLAEMAALCVALGRYDEVERALREAEEIVEENWSVQRGNLCLNRAVLCRDTGAYADGLDWTSTGLALPAFAQRFTLFIVRAELFLGCGRAVDAGDVIARISDEFPDGVHDTSLLDIKAWRRETWTRPCVTPSTSSIWPGRPGATSTAPPPGCAWRPSASPGANIARPSPSRSRRRPDTGAWANPCDAAAVSR